MSLGFCGLCKIYDQDEKNIYYSYSGENWNEPTSKKGDRLLYDGLIKIKKSTFVSETATSYFSKVYDSIANGDIKVLIECKNAFRRYTDFDYIALRVLFNIFKEYEEDNDYPIKTGFIQ